MLRIAVFLLFPCVIPVPYWFIVGFEQERSGIFLTFLLKTVIIRRVLP